MSRSNGGRSITILYRRVFSNNNPCRNECQGLCSLTFWRDVLEFRRLSFSFLRSSPNLRSGLCEWYENWRRSIPKRLPILSDNKRLHICSFLYESNLQPNTPRPISPALKFSMILGSGAAHPCLALTPALNLYRLQC